MKIASWNIRGIGRAEKRRAVRRLLVNNKFDMFFIQESKLKEMNHRVQRWLWGNEPFLCEAVVSEGNLGGLISCWREEFFSMELKMVSQRFILVVGMVKSCNLKCGFGNLYAPNDDNDREAL
ncbi:hypothetical protein PTKIN_Ptkin04bG0027000 [Pterospermum kingtungense]